MLVIFFKSVRGIKKLFLIFTSYFNINNNRFRFLIFIITSVMSLCTSLKLQKTSYWGYSISVSDAILYSRSEISSILVFTGISVPTLS